MKGKRAKKPSKRIKLSVKYKVAKKVRQHDRKIKRDKKRHPEKYRKKKADPGIPSIVPFKKQVIEETMRDQEIETNNRKLQGAYIRSIQEKGETEDCFGNVLPYDLNSVKPASKPKPTDSPCDFQQIVKASDVILNVLDARDPQGSRCLSFEEMMKENPEKRLIYILNKADKVSLSNLKMWIAYLSKFHPTRPLKSRSISVKCATDDIVDVLNNFYRSAASSKESITVGVVGLPNVGKLSVIGSFKYFNKNAKINESSMPTLSLNANVQLLLKPGRITPVYDEEEDGYNLRASAYKFSPLNFMKPIQDLLNRVDKLKLMLHYNISSFDSAIEFLEAFQKRKSLQQKQHRKNREIFHVTVARSIIDDWKTGAIPFYTSPPPSNEEVETEIKNQIFESFQCIHPIKGILVPSFKPVQDYDTEKVDDDSDEEKVDNNEFVAVGEEEDENEVDEEDEIEVDEEDENEVDEEDESEVEEEEECPQLVLSRTRSSKRKAEIQSVLAVSRPSKKIVKHGRTK